MQNWFRKKVLKFNKVFEFWFINYFPLRFPLKNEKKDHSYSTDNELSKITYRGQQVYSDFFDIKKEIDSLEEIFLRSVEKELKENPKKWIEDRFNFSESLMRVFLERAFDNGELNKSFIINSHFIPRRRNMDINLLKSILISLGQKETSLGVSNLPNTEFMLNLIFKEYSDHQIANVYLRPFNVDILNQIMLNPKSVPVLKTFNEIYDALSYKVTINSYLNKIKEKKIQESNFLIKVLKTKREYSEASKSFSNCVSSYFYMDDLDIICFYRDEKPFACVSLKENNEVCETRGYKNKNLSNLEITEIKTAINSLQRCN